MTYITSGVHTIRYCVRTSCGVHESRLQFHFVLDQLHVIFCSRSLRIIRTETGKVLTFPLTSPTNSNITMPKTLLLLRKRFIFASTFVFLRSLSGHDRHHCFLFRFWKALILFRTVSPAVYCPSSWIQASSNRCWFALLDRDTEGHVIVLIVDQVFLSYNMEHRNHL